MGFHLRESCRLFGVLGFVEYFPPDSLRVITEGNSALPGAPGLSILGMGCSVQPQTIPAGTGEEDFPEMLPSVLRLPSARRRGRRAIPTWTVPPPPNPSAVGCAQINLA